MFNRNKNVKKFREGPEFKAVKIFSVNGTKLEADWNTIDEIFYSKREIREKHLKIIVACGFPRKGKSSICNLLYNCELKNETKCDNQEYDDGLIGQFGTSQLFDDSSHQSNQKLRIIKNKSGMISKVFETGNGMKHKTSGIWITPQPIIQLLPNGEEINVFIIDCQGVFGSGEKLFINQKVFVLGALIASHLIYNVMLPFEPQDDELLKNFLQSTRTLLNIGHNKPFQSLFFLFRDLLNENEFKFGSKGVDNYLKFLKDEQSMIDLKSFESYFDRVKFYLMPKPNDMISNQRIPDTDQEFNVNDFGDTFMKHCKQFRDEVINRNDDTLKRSENGQLLYGYSIAALLRNWFECVENGTLTELPDKEKLLSDRMNSQYIESIRAQYNEEFMIKIEDFTKSFTLRDFDERLPLLITMKNNCIKRAQEMFSKRAWNQGIGSDNIDFNKRLVEKFNNEFNEFHDNINLIKTLWSKYLRDMSKYLYKNENLVKTMTDENVKREHEKLKEENLKLFKEKCINRGQIYEFRLKNELKDRINKFYEYIDLNSVHLYTAIKDYENRLEDGFKKSQWFEIGSNTWLELDNEIYDSIDEQLWRNIRGESSEMKFDFNAILRSETEKRFKIKYEKSLKKENRACFGVGLAGIGVAVVGAVTLPAVAVIGGLGLVTVGVFKTCRWKFKPQLRREDISEKVKIL
jgi:hypothetical protein